MEQLRFKVLPEYSPAGEGPWRTSRDIREGLYRQSDRGNNVHVDHSRLADSDELLVTVTDNQGVGAAAILHLISSLDSVVEVEPMPA